MSDFELVCESTNAAPNFAGEVGTDCIAAAGEQRRIMSNVEEGRNWKFKLELSRAHYPAHCIDLIMTYNLKAVAAAHSTNSSCSTSDSYYRIAVLAVECTSNT